VKIGDFCSPEVVTVEPAASLRVVAVPGARPEAVISTELANLAEALRWERKRELAARKRL
jgi:hypothetical protein